MCINEDNEQARRAWDANARYWDERMADGNNFFKRLIWPAVEGLLDCSESMRYLDVACGNGVTSRRLAAAGARVVAIDFSAELIQLARARAPAQGVDYRVVDVTNYDALLSLGAESFDGALCNMALMDIADLRPLMKALARLLRPSGRFVFSVLHPCFNSPGIVQVGELTERDGRAETTYSVKVSRYLTPFTQAGEAMRGQPVPHPYFHRPLGALLRAGFEVGFVVNALDERAFPPEYVVDAVPLAWSGLFSEIPPILVVRMIRNAA
jgi:2-polyprenyl-3-methyl-5-hydroxy-6-metoxy-1,4-benzoquinol methylase